MPEGHYYSDYDDYEKTPSIDMNGAEISKRVEKNPIGIQQPLTSHWDCFPNVTV